MAHSEEVKELRAIWVRLSNVMDNLEKKKPSQELQAYQIANIERHGDSAALSEVEAQEALNALDRSVEYLREALDFLDESNGGGSNVPEDKGMIKID